MFSLLLGITSAAISAPPATPLGVAMVANSADSISIAWYRPAADDVLGYIVYAGEKADGPFVKVAVLTERTFTHEKVKADTQMYYRVAATNADGSSEPTKPVLGFTIKPAEPTPFPVKVATNMCVSLGATILCDSPPVKGKVESLVDGLDATDCRLKDTCPADADIIEAAFPADDRAGRRFGSVIGTEDRQRLLHARQRVLEHLAATRMMDDDRIAIGMGLANQVGEPRGAAFDRAAVRVARGDVAGARAATDAEQDPRCRAETYMWMVEKLFGPASERPDRP
jgi:hypothetical protein